MKRAILAIICSAVLIGAGFAIVQSANGDSDTYRPPTVKKVENPPTREELIKLVNVERARKGVESLKVDSRLNKSAQQKADDMQKYDYYAHQSTKSPNHNGDSHYWIFDTGISCVSSGENLDENSTAEAAVAAWNGSPSHYKAMVSKSYNATGFGISAKNKYGYYYLVEHFCQYP